MFVLIFLIGALLVLGATLGARYVRQELTARIGPTMDLVLLKLDDVQGAVNLALANWHASCTDTRHRPGRHRIDESRVRMPDRSGTGH